MTRYYMDPIAFWIEHLKYLKGARETFIVEGMGEVYWLSCIVHAEKQIVLETIRKIENSR